MRTILVALIVAASVQLIEAQTTFNSKPTRVVGHASIQEPLKSGSPNLVEGRELWVPQSLALDLSLSPPALYVADTGNNRVLGWRNAAGFANGAYADIVIGQRDKVSTFALGPGTTLRTGLAAPTGLAVDSEGNLYVVDTGNNRILRFAKPFSQPDELKQPNMVVGQTSFDTRTANPGGVSASTVAVSTARGTFRSALLFDSNGNLWFSDSGNNRVLRYPAAVLAQGTNGPAADLALGQLNLTSNTALAIIPPNRTNKSGMNAPSGLALDTGGRLYVVDALSRVLVYPAPLQTGMAAVRIMGVIPPVPGQPQAPPVNDTELKAPEGVFMIGATPAAVDTGNHRILVYDRFESWPPENCSATGCTLFSPPAKQVIGQQGMDTAKAKAGDTGLNTPIHAVFSGSELYVADSGNNRVVVFPQGSGPASRVLGQLSVDYTAPNLIEGRELNLAVLSGTTLVAAGGGLAIDAASEPPRLYIADTFNNRVLGYKDARRVRPGDTADLVIGQPDMFRSQINYPTNDVAQTNDSGLLRPSGVAVDSEGNLYVADSGNSRVLRFAKPFDPANPSALPRANLVLGQASFFPPKIGDPTRRNLAVPFGLAFTAEGHLLVSDSDHNRVLLFRKPASGDFSNGMEASAHFGQPDFSSIGASSADNRFAAPRAIAMDTSGRLYVADSGNSRVMIFANAAAVGPDDDPRPVVTLTNSTAATRRLGSPYGVVVNPLTGEIWIAETIGSRLLRYPEFSFLPANNFLANAALPANAPVAVALDGFGNPVASEIIHRVAFFSPATVGVNAANYANRPVAPGMYVALYPAGGQFSFQETKRFDELPNPIPMPKELADIQVLINGQPAPLHFVSPRQINFFMPMSAPASGTVEAMVVRSSTGQVIAASPLRMDVASPGLFTAAASGSGQLAALNQDSSFNSPSSPAARGEVVQLFGTGQGFMPNAPPDGEPASGLTPTDEKPRVFIGTNFVADSDVLYSGLAPGLIGVWQINFKIPDRVAPGSVVVLFVQHKDIPSSPTPQTRTTIAVK